MFNRLCKLLFLYVVLTLIFSDLSAIKDPGKDFFVQQYEDVSRIAKKFANYVDDNVIPKVDTFFEENGDKNLAGTIVESFTVEKEPFSEGLMTGKVEEDTFFNEEEK
jgi:hypothetical protein